MLTRRRAAWVAAFITAGVVIQLNAGQVFGAIPLQAAESYECSAKPADAAKPPPIPTAPPLDGPYQTAPKSERPLCPEGDVPYFKGVASSNKAMPPSPAGYSHETGAQGVSGTEAVPAYTSGLYGYTGQEEPFLDPSDPSAHSLDQMWLVAPNGSTVEYGWTVDRSLNGDAHPHLFIYRFDGGSPTCYNSGERYSCPTATKCTGAAAEPHRNGWVQVSTTEAPGEQVGVNPYLDSYLINDYEGNWWFLHDGTWLGYYASCAWANFPNGIPRNEAGGEIYSSGNQYCIDSQMGNGGAGANYENADLWTGLEQEITKSGGSPTGVAAAQMTGESDELTTQYSVGQYSPSAGHASQFRFGGGAC